MYPAIAVLHKINLSKKVEESHGSRYRELQTTTKQFQPMDVLWVGSVGGMEEELVKREGIPFEAISAAGIHGVGFKTLPGNLFQLKTGYQESKRILDRFNPDVLFFTGGYVAVPMAIAGRRIPSLLFVPDIEPGMAIKTIARFANRIAVTTKESQTYFPNQKVIVTGYPTRPQLKMWNVEDARKKLNLEKDLQVLLVFGGSKGARSINNALLSALPELLPDMQIVHITGTLDWADVQKQRSSMNESLPLIERYHIYPYLHEEMGAALSVADLVLSRAGASCLGEFPLFGLPAILVPYPYAWRYQQVNANYLASRGAGIVIKDEDLKRKLIPVVHSVLKDGKHLGRMREAMKRLAKPDAAKEIESALYEIASPGVGKGSV